MNYIFVPNAKHFIFPCAMIQKHYQEERAETAFLVVPKSMNPVMSVLGLAHINFDQVDWSEFEDAPNLVFFHHDTDVVYRQFLESVKKVRSAHSVSDLYVSFFPDGLGNAMRGENYVEQTKKISGAISNAIRLRDVFSFGFVHDSTRVKFGQSKIAVLSYRYLISVIEGSTYLQQVCSTIIKQCDLNNDVVFVPYRPWATEKFHNGVYSFGNDQQHGRLLAEIVTEIAEDCELSKAQLVYRGDERFKGQSDAVFFELKNSLAQFPNVTVKSIDDDYPDELTLEPILFYFMKKLSSDNKMCFAVLDSTTFQAVPFLSGAMHAKGPRLIGYIGARRRSVEKMDGGAQFVNSKLVGKVRDFRGRYEEFATRGGIGRVTPVDDTAFWVEV